MTVTYKTRGRLTEPVSDLDDARAYLRQLQSELRMASVIYPDEAKDGVHSVTWDLLDDEHWEVTLVADHPLENTQLELLADWISGQNSDGIGESFEQQPFAEHEDEDDDGEIVYHTSSFDWEENNCFLEVEYE